RGDGRERSVGDAPGTASDRRTPRGRGGRPARRRGRARARHRGAQLFAFSADNWGRPRPEVAALMRLLRAYLRAETARCVENGLRVSVIGRRDPPAPSIVLAMRRVVRATRRWSRLQLWLARDPTPRAASERE